MQHRIKEKGKKLSDALSPVEVMARFEGEEPQASSIIQPTKTFVFGKFWAGASSYHYEYVGTFTKIGILPASEIGGEIDVNKKIEDCISDTDIKAVQSREFKEEL